MALAVNITSSATHLEIEIGLAVFFISGASGGKSAITALLGPNNSPRAPRRHLPHRLSSLKAMHAYLGARKSKVTKKECYRVGQSVPRTHCLQTSSISLVVVGSQM